MANAYSRFVRACVVLFVLCIVVAISAGETYTTQGQIAESLFFSSALRDAHVSERVSIGDKMYVVTDGAVSYQGLPVASSDALRALRLTYEKSAARRDPLISLSAVEPKEFIKAVGYLRDTAALLAQRQKRPLDALLVHTSLYPTDFLMSAARTEQARRTFLESGSVTDAYLYESELRSTISAYRADISRFRRAFLAAVPADEKRYATYKNIVDRNDITDALKMLDVGMSDTSRVFSKRLACFGGKISECETADVQLPTLIDPPDAYLSPTTIAFAEHIRTLNSDKVGAELDPKSDPLIQLSESACMNLQPSTGLLFTFQKMPSLPGVPAFHSPLFVGDLIFIRSTTYASLPFYSYFASNNIEYVPTRILTYYECPETARDQGTLIAIQTIRDFAGSSHLSSYAVGETKKTLEQFEEKLTSRPIVSEKTAVDYLKIAETLIETGRVPTPLADTITELVLGMRDKSAGTYQTALQIAYYEQSNMRLSDVGGVGIDFGVPYFFFARSGFASLFMEGSLSVIEHHPDFFSTNNLSADEQPFVLYSTLLRTSTLEAGIVRDLIFFREIKLGQFPSQ